MRSWVISSGIKRFPVRLVSQQRHYGQLLKEVHIPPKPKKPLTPYFRFLGQVRTEIQKENPSLKPTELTKVVAQRWEQMDESSKAPYIIAYRNDMEEYSSILEEYKRSLTSEQLEAQQQLNLEKRKKKRRLKEPESHEKALSPFFVSSTSPLDSNFEDRSNLRFTKEGEEEAIQIFKSTDDHKFELNEEALEKVLLQNDIKELPVAVVSIAGAFRKGKSFMLDFFLRYLKAGGRVDWMGNDDQPLDGFAWRGGAERHTSGILLWPEVFKVRVPSGEEIAVLLMDTQGAFDSESTVRDCATIFALSTMLSSVQIYNLSQNIREDDLQHLRSFTEYGRLALEECGDMPFQKLQFLVRDWSYPYEAAYGLEGGKEVLDRRLRVHEAQHDELQALRKHIRSCFAEISCYLMPHPGLRVATNPTFDGRLSDIKPEFRKQLAEYVPLVLHPKNLLVKKIAGQNVKSHELLHYFKSYSAVYQGDKLPEPKWMFEATAEANNLSAVATCRTMYLTMMEDVCGEAKPFMPGSQLVRENNRIKETALSQFQSVKKVGGNEFSAKYKKMLEEDIDKLFENFRALNETKTLFKNEKTPTTLITVAGGCYVLSGLFGIVGIDSISNMFNLGVGLTLLGPTAYAYVRSGRSFKSTPLSIPVPRFPPTTPTSTLLNIKHHYPSVQSRASSVFQTSHSTHTAAENAPKNSPLPIKYKEQLRDIGSHVYTGASTVWEHVLKPTGVYVKRTARRLKTATTEITNKMQQKKSN